MELILYAPSMPFWRGHGKRYVYILQYMFSDFNNFRNAGTVLYMCGYYCYRPMVTMAYHMKVFEVRRSMYEIVM